MNPGIKAKIKERESLVLGAAILCVTAPVNYFAGTPWIFTGTFFATLALVYAAYRLKKSFDVPFFFIRRDGGNYWAGAFGALLGGLGGLYGSTRSPEILGSSMKFFAELGFVAVIAFLGSVLFMGTILSDIRDGYIDPVQED